MTKRDSVANSSDEQDSFIGRMGMVHLRMGGCRGAVVCWVTIFKQGNSCNTTAGGLSKAVGAAVGVAVGAVVKHAT